VNSPDGYHGKSQLLEMAKRLKKHKIKLLVDFHYADSWADPGKQPKPAAWQGLDFERLKQALYDHTYDICGGLKEQGTPPDMMQIGNEITNGMLWPDGRNDKSFDNLAALLKEGFRAVKDCSPETRVMLQLDNGCNNQMYRWWFDSILERKVPFDLIGVSYYPYWHGTLADLQNNLNDIAVRYDKDIIVVETAYPFAPGDPENKGDLISFEEYPGYPFTPEGQARMFGDIMTIVRAVPNGRGLGVMWALMEEKLPVLPMNAVFASDVPRGSGLSSSASVEMAFMIAWQTLGDWTLPAMQRALLGQKAENQYVGVNCGIMDQFASACGVANKLLLLDCRSLKWKTILCRGYFHRDRRTAVADSPQRIQQAPLIACEEAVRLLKQDLPDINRCGM
jgi:arabinogalactan endo-1,4-beta-galactosidase